MLFLLCGCKVNQYETNGMAQKLMPEYDVVEPEEKADIYIINTCSVTNMSDRKSRQMIRRAKEMNPDAFVIVVGCYAEANIDKYIEAYFDGKDINDDAIESYFYDFGSITYTEKTRAVVKVQDGCNNFCTYCIIPYARGRICSRRPESVIDEITKIAREGIKEVVITGIQVSAYGKDFDNDYRLIDLLEEINKVDGIERIRLGSIEPLMITDEFCERVKKLDKMCHHFHLSLQSGCDKTLKEMNRRYTTAQFEEVVGRLRNIYDDVILTTDIIVGFPNETDEDFEQTYEFLKRIKFYKMHVFKYSQRRGTVAAKMKNQISPEIKEVRSKRLLKLSSDNEKDYLDGYVGKDVKVLFEERDGEYIKGHTDNYVVVECEGSDEDLNRILSVHVEKSETENLVGKLI